ICDGSHVTARNAPRYSATASRKGAYPMGSPYPMMSREILRACRLISLDQTPIGKWSRSVQPRHGSSQACADPFMSAARRETARLPLDSVSIDVVFGRLSRSARHIASGIDCETQVPAPTKG